MMIASAIATPRHEDAERRVLVLEQLLPQAARREPVEDHEADDEQHDAEEREDDGGDEVRTQVVEDGHVIFLAGKEEPK